MNYGQLKTVVLAETHRQDYIADVAGFIERGEALIRSFMESYTLEDTLTDANRTTVGGPIYNLPDRTTMVRQIIRSDGLPLDRRDETSVYGMRNIGEPLVYVQRPKTIRIASTPGTGDTFTLLRFGMPAALAADADTNQLLTDYPQLYQEAASVYVYHRAKNKDDEQICYDKVKNLAGSINRITKKLIGGAESSPAYNTQFRSSF